MPIIGTDLLTIQLNNKQTFDNKKAKGITLKKTGG
jgi:hypothetical protein